MTESPATAYAKKTAAELSLFRLLDPEVLADPYPLYHRLRGEDPVHWDPFLHSWVVTRYTDVVRVLRDFSAQRAPTTEQLTTLGLAALNPVAKVMVKQMLFLDPPEHARIRSLASAAFTPQRVGALRSHIREIVRDLLAMVGGQETTTNLIGSGTLSLLRNPDELEKLRANLFMIPAAVEELLRYESPSQHTARLAPEDIELGGKLIRKRQAVRAVMAAANRDPERFPDPDRLDITRQDNRHVAFGYGAHFCFGAPLARIEGQIAFEEMIRELPNWSLNGDKLVWRTNLGLRGLTSLWMNFTSNAIGNRTLV